MTEPEAADDFTLALSAQNLSWVEDLYLAYRTNPESVDELWRRRFAAWDRDVDGHVQAENGHARGSAGPTSAPPRPTFVAAPIAPASEVRPTTPAAPAAPAPSDLGAMAADRALRGKRIRRLIEDFRDLGHLAADLDPLGLQDRRKARLRLEDYGVGEADLDTVVAADDVGGPDSTTLRELLALLDETYCRHFGVELGHIHDGELRGWLQTRMETSRNRVALSRRERLELVGKVTEAEVFEQFLQNKFVGAKRFSLEGAESVIPLLDRTITRAARAGVTQIVIGMAHRGRLNVLTHVMGKPAAEIFAEFLDRPTDIHSDEGGDVKYHLGYSTDRVTADGRVHISLGFNPSHLEWVNTVVQGRVRAKQDRAGNRLRGLAILVHGDAAFAGQGVVAEALNLSALPGYSVGGTIHIIVNNQIGFTTPPQRAYSTTYPTDVARMLQIPIFHINGEDPEAVVQAVDLAVDFRQRFGRDVVIDLWCYRKLGHNEGDEPGYTQPLMYKAIRAKPSVRAGYLRAFAMTPNDEPPVGADDAEAVATARRQQLDEALEAARRFQAPPRPSTFAGIWARVRGGFESGVRDVPTAASAEAVRAVGRALAAVPEGFAVHPKLVKVIEARGEMAEGKRPVDWGTGEALAFGTLLQEGVSIRLSGQDSRRGTFSHRHAVLVDHETGAEYVPLQHVADKQGRFEVFDSPLSEAGVLGFDYGYSLDAPDGLVIWEAQFGDFVNGAQVIIDQFLASSEVKWRRVSGLVMLLPHGMEGQGPEHSSARLERFLSAAVNDNIQVCNVTTPAQFFHLLRRQVLRPYRKPLIVMSPKSLLRHPDAVSPIEDFTGGVFRHVLPDPTTPDPRQVRRILLCSGKIYYDLAAARLEHGLRDVAIIRVEQLYPLRREEILEAVADYPTGIPLCWVQEEPRNMAAWHHMNRQIGPLVVGDFKWSGITRPMSSSPAVGSASRHRLEQAHLVDEALGVTPARKEASS